MYSDVRAHQRAHAQRRTAIVAEREERRPKRNQPAVRRNSVHHRHHPKLAHAKEHVAPLRIHMEARRVLEDRLRRARQIRRATRNSSGTTFAMAFITTCPALRVADRLLGREGRNRLLPSLASSSPPSCAHTARPVPDTPSCTHRTSPATPPGPSCPFQRPAASSCRPLQERKNPCLPGSPGSSW